MPYVPQRQRTRRTYQNTDLDLLTTLYRPSIPHTIPPEPLFSEAEFDDDDFDNEYNHHTIAVNGVNIRFIENTCDIIMRVEGELSDAVMNTIIDKAIKGQSFKESKKSLICTISMLGSLSYDSDQISSNTSPVKPLAL